MVVATTTAPAFGGADQWWLRLPDASLVYASGTSDGGAVLLTRLRQAEALGPYTAIRLLPDGTPAWEVTLDGLEIPTGILETGDGGVLVVEGDQLTKLDSYGTLLWTRSYPFGDSDSFTYTEELFGPIQDVRSNGDGTQVIGRFGSIVTLDQEGAPVEYHMAASLDNVITDDEWVSAAAPDSVYFGEWESDSVFRFGRRSTVGPSWESRFDFINFDITLLAPPEFIRPTLDGGALFIGLAPNLIADGGSAIWIARLGRSGNVMWQRIYDGVYEDDFYAIETSDGGFLIADTDTFFGRVYQGSFLRLTRFNSSGYILWDRTYGDGETQIQIQQIIERSDGGFLFVGQHSFEGEDDYAHGVAVLSVDRQGRIPGCRFLTDVSKVDMLGKSPAVSVISTSSDGPIVRDVFPPAYEPYRMVKLLKANVIFDVMCSYPAVEFQSKEGVEDRAERIHPFAVSDGLLLGAVQGKDWYSAEEAVSHITRDANYRLYNLTSHTGDAHVEIMNPPADSPCAEKVYLDFMTDESTPFRVALDASWNAIPHISTTLSNDIALYVDVVRRWLRDHGISDPEVSIDQVLAVDLQGDGADEVLIDANRNASGLRERGVSGGDYSLLLLRRIGAGGVETIPLFERYERVANAQRLAGEIETVAVLDLNGDGAMEILARDVHAESFDYLIYDPRMNPPSPVLQAGCGG